MIRLALRNLLSRKRRTLLHALAVVVGVAQVTGAFVLTDSMNSQIDDLFASGSKGIEVVVARRPTATIPTRPHPGGRGRTRARRRRRAERRRGDLLARASSSPMASRQQRPAVVRGIAESPERSTSWKLTSGTWAQADDETVLDEATAKRVGWKIGDRVTVVGADGAERLRLTGLATFGARPSGRPS